MAPEYRINQCADNPQYDEDGDISKYADVVVFIWRDTAVKATEKWQSQISLPFDVPAGSPSLADWRKAAENVVRKYLGLAALS